jgi:molybdopterin molybdotransferase
MLSVKEAKEILFKNFNIFKKGRVALKDSLNYILSKDIIAPDYLPRFSNSAMDGYAIKFKNLKYKIVGKINSGDPFYSINLKEGEAIEISTGAPIPKGADTVVPIEDLEVKDGFIFIKKEVKKGENIRKKGEDVKKGKIILKKGETLNPQKIGLLAALGIKEVEVFLKPEVGVITTGSEVVKIDKEPKNFQIRNSNSYIIYSFLKKLGIEPKFIKHFPDEKGKILKFLKSLKKHPDFLILTGGVSVGGKDYVKEELENFGIRRLFWKVAQKPGKPIYAGIKGKTFYFGIPGNPGAAIICLYIYVYPLICKFMQKKDYELKKIDAILISDVKNKSLRSSFINCIYSKGKVKVLKEQGSHRLLSFSKSNCFLELKPKGKLKKGQKVKVYLF